jgi:hypothetical protein
MAECHDQVLTPGLRQRQEEGKSKGWFKRLDFIAKTKDKDQMGSSKVNRDYIQVVGMQSLARQCSLRIWLKSRRETRAKRGKRGSGACSSCMLVTSMTRSIP